MAGNGCAAQFGNGWCHVYLRALSWVLFLTTLSSPSGYAQPPLAAMSANNVSQSQEGMAPGSQLAADSPRPTLYFLGIGTGVFEKPGLVPELSFVDDDLRGMLAWARDQQNKVFGEVVTETLEGKDASRSTILAALSRFGRQTPSGNKISAEDLVVVYIAGHGLVDQADGSYYYLTWDLKTTDVRNDALRYDDLIARLMEQEGDKRSVLVLMDTCQSGAVVNGVFQRLLQPPVAGDNQARGWEVAQAPSSNGTPTRKPSAGKPTSQNKPSTGAGPKPIANPASAPAPSSTPVFAPEPGTGIANGAQAPSSSTAAPEDASRGVGTGRSKLDEVRRRAELRQVWAVFSATAALQLAQEGKKYRHDWEGPEIAGHGVFTWALLDALRTTHADQNRDGRVSMLELTSHVQEKVQEKVGQQPNLAGRQADRAISYARGAEEECDGLDNNYDGIVDNGFADLDADGVADCLNSEQCNGRDDNGNGIIDEGFDKDHDGHLAMRLCPNGIGTDCNDRNPAIHPMAKDIGDLKDNNCNGIYDEQDVKIRWDANIPDYMEQKYHKRRDRTLLAGLSTLALGAVGAGTFYALHTLPQSIGADGSYQIDSKELNRARALGIASGSLIGLSTLSFGVTLYYGTDQIRFALKYFPPNGK